MLACCNLAAPAASSLKLHVALWISVTGRQQDIGDTWAHVDDGFTIGGNAFWIELSWPAKRIAWTEWADGGEYYILLAERSSALQITVFFRQFEWGATSETSYLHAWKSWIFYWLQSEAWELFSDHYISSTCVCSVPLVYLHSSTKLTRGISKEKLNILGTLPQDSLLMSLLMHPDTRLSLLANLR